MTLINYVNPKVWQVISQKGIDFYDNEHSAYRSAVNTILEIIKQEYDGRRDHNDFRQINWKLADMDKEAEKEGYYDYYAGYKEIIELWNKDYWQEAVFGKAYPKPQGGKVRVEEVELFSAFPVRPAPLDEKKFEAIAMYCEHQRQDAEKDWGEERNYKYEVKPTW